MFGWTYYLTPYMITVFVVGLLFAWLPMETWRVRENLTGLRAIGGALLGIILMAAAVAELASSGFNPFIYFQF